LTVAEYIGLLEEFGDSDELFDISAAALLRALKLRHQQRDGKADRDVLLTAKEAAAMLKVSSSFLYSGAGKHISVIKIGRRKMYSRAVIERFIRQNSNNA
jgi:hypothetical protein